MRNSIEFHLKWSICKVNYSLAIIKDVILIRQLSINDRLKKSESDSEGIEVWSLESGIWNLEFDIRSLEFEIWSLEFEIWNFELEWLKFEIWCIKRRSRLTQSLTIAPICHDFLL